MIVLPVECLLLSKDTDDDDDDGMDELIEGTIGTLCL